MIEDEKYTKVILISSQIGELNEDELNELKSRNYIPSDYTGGDYFGIKGDENIFSIETLAYSFASDDGVASLKIDDVEYVAVPKMMMILVVDNETGRVVDVGGLRDDTRELTKY